MKRLLIALSAFVLLHGVSWAAGSPSSPVAPAVPAAASATPDPSANPVLANLQKMGAKFFYLGNHSGLDGWFIVKGGQVHCPHCGELLWFVRKTI